MLKGSVKWFDKDKGYGIILPEDGAQDVFVHFADVVDAEPHLSGGERVEFEVIETPQGLRAVNVRRVDAGASPGA